MTFGELRKNLKKNFDGFKSVKLAILGDSATQLFAQAIRGMGYVQLLNIQIYEADFNQIDMQIFDTSSELYAFQPDVTLIFESGHKLLQKYNKTTINSRESFAENQIEHVHQLINTLRKNLNTKIIFCNYAEEDDQVFGNYGSRTSSSFIFQQRKLNYLLAESAIKENFYICDLSAIQSKMGRNILFSPSIYVNSEMVLNIDSLPTVAEPIVRIIAVFQGRQKKCIILDLDNTLWGGVIGDDGLENIQIGQLGIGKAFTEFQYWVKKLQQRGIIVCVCSKNTESLAKEPFEKHPDMVLRLSDISIFMANWENKVDNIKHIQQILNIGFDSIVFIDDNPMERDVVRQNLPQVTVPELPKDPAEYLEYLYTLDLFETTSYSSEDKNRTEQYQKESERMQVKASFSNEDDFLKSLEMVSDVQNFNSFTIPRIAQLSQRSNQFNLRTVRYTEEDVKRIASADNYQTFSFTLEDRFGDNGLISAVIIEKREATKDLFIENWFMSCRVLKRGMENFIVNTIANYAQQEGYKQVIGEYLPTDKNVIVKNLYETMGFAQKENIWVLNIDAYKIKKCFINVK